MALTEIIAIIAAAIMVPFCARLIYLYAVESKARIKAERAKSQAEHKLENIERMLGLPAEDVVTAIKEYKIRKEEKE